MACDSNKFLTLELCSFFSPSHSFSSHLIQEQGRGILCIKNLLPRVRYVGKYDMCSCLYNYGVALCMICLLSEFQDMKRFKTRPKYVLLIWPYSSLCRHFDSRGTTFISSCLVSHTASSPLGEPPLPPPPLSGGGSELVLGLLCCSS